MTRHFFPIAVALTAFLAGCVEKPDDPAPVELAVPQNVVLHSATETSLTFQWDVVEGAVRYAWKLTTADDGSQREGTSTQRNATVSGLRKGSQYLFSVRAEADDRTSGWSSELSATTEGTATPPGGQRKCVDEPLVLEFDSAPELGSSGLIKVFTASGSEVDRIDLADMANMQRREDGITVPASQLAADSVFHTFLDALPCGGNWRPVHFTPLLIDGKSLIIRLHSGALDFDTEYYVTIDAGVVKGFNGTSAGEWKFTTAKAPADATSLRVSADGSGDFCTIQRALDYADKKGCEISIANGIYREMLYVREKAGLTLKGDSRDGVKIIYPNNESYESGSGGHTSSRPSPGSRLGASGGRSLMLVENCNNLQLKGLTIRNSYGEQGQAETIYFNSGSNAHRLIIEDCALYSLQDTFLCKGEVYVHNSLIAGNVDFIWGYPKACLFEDCEIRCEYHKNGGYVIQARVPAAGDKGFVFLNCRITTGEGAKDGSVYLARSAGQKECFDNVTFVGCTMAPVIAPAGWYTSPAPNPATPTASSGWKEYGSVTPAGASATGSRNAYGRILTADEAAAYTSKTAVLGW